MNMLAQQQYKQNAVTTASPAELTLMLYKGAVRFVNIAKQAIIKGDIEEANRSNLRAQDIVKELMSTLDTKYPISENLMALYDYLLRRLIQANIEKNVEILDEVKGYLEEFVITWTEAMKEAKRK
jgi:flagellar protein FliS